MTKTQAVQSCIQGGWVMLGSPLSLGMRASILFTNDTFAYWFDSDVGPNPEAKTPIVGKYSVNGWRVTLCPEDDKRLYSINWYIFCHGGCLTLIPAAQYRNWLDSGHYDASLLLWHVDSFDTNDPLMPMSSGVLFAGRPLTFRLHDSRNGPDGRRLLTFHVRAKNSRDVEYLDLTNTTNTPSLFTGTLPTVAGKAHPSNGMLEVQECDVVVYNLIPVHAQQLNMVTNRPPSEIRVIPVKQWHWGEPTSPGDAPAAHGE